MIRRALAALLLAAGSAPALAAEPLDTILAAFEAETRQPVEAARLFIERAGVVDLYVIERVAPGRLRMVVNPRQGGAELIVVDGQQWLRTAPGGWARSPATAAAQPPSLVALLRAGMTEPTEQATEAGMRVFVGRVAWTNGRPSEGRLEVRIDGDGLPRALRFEGTCGGAPCRFHQRMDYGGPLSIEPP